MLKLTMVYKRREVMIPTDKLVFLHGWHSHVSLEEGLIILAKDECFFIVHQLFIMKINIKIKSLYCLTFYYGKKNFLLFYMQTLNKF